MIILLFITGACNKKLIEDCENANIGARLVSCYSEPYFDYPSQVELNLCTATDNPPCGPCYEHKFDLDGNETWTDVSGEFIQPCRDIFGNIGTIPIEVDQPYSFNCQGDLCTQYNTYYFDLQPNSTTPDNTSLDGAYRPIYIKFKIPNFNLNIQDYYIKIFEPGNTTNPIAIATLSSATSPSIRYLNPADCNSTSTDGCSTEGIVKLELDNVQTEGTYKIEMSSAAGTINPIISTTFVVKNIDINDFFQSNHRSLNLLNYANGNYDLSSYDINGKKLTQLSNSILDWVIGSGTSNIETNVINAATDLGGLTNSEGYPLVNANGEMMLDGDYFRSGDTKEIFQNNLMERIHVWAKDLYTDSKLSYGNIHGIILEINGIGIYDFKPSVPVKQTIYDDVLKEFKDWGVTLQNTPLSSSYYNCLIVWAHNIKKDEYVPTTSVNLAVGLHEIGHIWSTGMMDESKSGDDFKHNSYCNGKGKGLCLFQNSAIYEAFTVSKDPTNWQQFLTTISSDPFYCEGHQQILMNQLIPK